MPLIVCLNRDQNGSPAAGHKIWVWGSIGRPKGTMDTQASLQECRCSKRFGKALDLGPPPQLCDLTPLVTNLGHKVIFIVFYVCFVSFVMQTPVVTKSAFEARFAAQKALWAHSRVCKNVDVLKGWAKLWTSGLTSNLWLCRWAFNH